MDVDLEGVVVLTDDQAVADGGEVQPQGLQIHRALLADDEHRVEGEGDVLLAEGVEVGTGAALGAVQLRHGLALEAAQHAL